jgi:DNA-directed RNA polymerase subunit beta
MKKKKGLFYLTENNEKYLQHKVEKKIISKNKISKLYSKKVKYTNIEPNQILSIGTNLIPFLEHNDANRALMGSNMQKQAMPLKMKETPIVQTGSEKHIAKESTSNIIIKKSGLIKYSSSKKIIINEMTKANKKKFLNWNFKLKLQKKILNIVSFNKKSKYKKRIYRIDENRKNNQNIYQIQSNIFLENEWIKKGKILTDNVNTKNSNLCIGKNLLIGYMSLDGYNFEDSIIINERLVHENILTSIYNKKYKTLLINNESGKEKLTKYIPNLDLQTSKKLKKNGIIKSGLEIKTNSILIGKIKKKSENSIEERLINSILKKNILKNTSLKLPKSINCKISKIQLIKNSKKYVIIINTIENRKIEIGDKLSGRHGNKGIISKILKSEEMPFNMDGKILDIIINPLGIPSRMNLGQIFEQMLGLAGHYLNENYQVKTFSSKLTTQTSSNLVHNKLLEARIKTKKKWIFNPHNPGKSWIFNGKTGEKFEQPINIGYNYILKLVHMVEDKLNARLIGPYSFTNQQPLKGKAKKGGQRIGEMEVWALEGYGLAYTLHEMLTLKSDDVNNRATLLQNLIEGKNLPKPNLPQTLKIFILELQCLCIEINLNLKKKLFTN